MSFEKTWIWVGSSHVACSSFLLSPIESCETMQQELLQKQQENSQAAEDGKSIRQEKLWSEYWNVAEALRSFLG